MPACCCFTHIISFNPSNNPTGKCSGFLFWLPGVPCRILVPQPRTELQPSAVKVQSPNHWTTREFPGGVFTLTYNWRNGIEKFSYLHKSNSWLSRGSRISATPELVFSITTHRLIAIYALNSKTYHSLYLVALIRNYIIYHSLCLILFPNPWCT